MTIDVVGPVTADIFVEADHFPVGTDMEFGPASLALIRGPARLTVGGNAGRAAWLLAKLGASVRLHTSLGTDPLGQWLAAELRAVGVRVIPTGLAGGTDATSTNCVAVDPAGHRMSFYFPGTIDYEQPAPASDSALVFAAACPLPLSAAVAGLLSRFRAAGAVTAIDPGPSLGRGRAAQGLPLVGPYVDYLSANSGELYELTGASGQEEAISRARAAGVGSLVLRHGASGSVVIARDGSAEDVPAADLPPEIRVTVGAGDAFNAGFLYGLTRGAGPYGSAVFASQVARSLLIDPAAPCLPELADQQVTSSVRNETRRN